MATKFNIRGSCDYAIDLIFCVLTSFLSKELHD